MSYRDFMSRPPTEGADVVDGLSPPWLQRPTGKAFLGALGDGLDFVSGAAKEAAKARLALQAPFDALPTMGTERAIERGPAEAEATYRARLVDAWGLWQWGGTALGVLRAFYVAGYSGVALFTGTGYKYALDGSQNLVETAFITEPWLGYGPPHWSDIALWFVGAWPAWWSGSPPADGTAEVGFMRRLLAAWKPAHCRVGGFGVISGTLYGFGGAHWGTGTWGGFTGTSVHWTPPVG